MSTNGAATSLGSGWWGRPGGGREVWTLAWPLVVSTSSWTVMDFLDRIFLIWYSPTAMAAAFPAVVLSFTVECFFLGVAMYVNAFVAQYYGAGRHHRIGLAVWQGIWLSLLAMPLMLATIPLAPAVFDFIGHEPAIRAQEVAYYQIHCVGAPGMVMAAAMSSFFTGRGRVRVVAIVDTIGAVVNVMIDYVLIFGYYGFPEMGIEGAAWGTVIGLWLRSAMYLTLILLKKNRHEFHTLSGCRFDRELFGRMLYYGYPAGVQMFVEVATFSSFLMLVGGLGPHELIATNLAFTINSLAFIPMMGMSMAVTTLVGQRLGQNEPELAARGTWTAYEMATLYMGAISLLYLLAPHMFLMPHQAGMDPGEFGALRDLTTVLLRFVAAYCLFDTMILVFVGALKGAGDTRFILFASLFMAPVPVLFTWLGTRVFGQGLLFSWVTITCWVCGLGTIYLIRFLQGKWRSMRVIEHAPPDLYTVGLDDAPTEEPAVAM